MHTSAEISLLYRVAELAKSFGLKPSEADAELTEILAQNGATTGIQLSFSGMTKAKWENFQKMTKALECNDDGVLITDDLGEMEDVVDQALALAPRARGR